MDMRKDIVKDHEMYLIELELAKELELVEKCSTWVYNSPHSLYTPCVYHDESYARADQAFFWNSIEC